MKKKLPVYRTLLSTLMIGALLWACHDALDPLPDCRLKHLKTTEYIVENQYTTPDSTKGFVRNEFALEYNEGNKVDKISFINFSIESGGVLKKNIDNWIITYNDNDQAYYLHHDTRDQYYLTHFDSKNQVDYITDERGNGYKYIVKWSPKWLEFYFHTEPNKSVQIEFDENTNPISLFGENKSTPNYQFTKYDQLNSPFLALPIAVKLCIAISWLTTAQAHLSYEPYKIGWGMSIFGVNNPLNAIDPPWSFNFSHSYNTKGFPIKTTTLFAYTDPVIPRWIYNTKYKYVTDYEYDCN